MGYLFKIERRIARWLVEIPTMVPQVPESDEGSNILLVTSEWPCQPLIMSP